MVTNEERVQRYAEALKDLSYGGKQLHLSHARSLAEYAIKVADAEQAELRAEVERLRGLLGVAEVRAGWKCRAEAAEAKAARVEALVDHWATYPHALMGIRNVGEVVAHDIRAALDGE